MNPEPFLVPQALRREYGKSALNEADVSSNPIEQFSRWFDQAKDLPEPNAMTLATADASGAPSARIVLLKEFDERGFVFFTNSQSRKGREMAENARAALLFYWQPLERQVRIEGVVERTNPALSEAYFHSRPREAQIGAWASQQSEVILSREDLERREAELAAKFGRGPIPLPDFWGGYRVIAHSMEFWQGRPSRLHDRLLYSRVPGGAWTLQRLSP